MSLYLSDGDIFAGWHSVGRWFALAAAVSGLAATAGYAFTHGYLATDLPASDQLAAFMAQWVGGGLAAIMAFAAFGSIAISRKERGDVEVDQAGIRRIFEPGRDNFLPREEIAGMIVRLGGGVTLVDYSGQERMVIPRSLDGYRDCIAEIKALGVERLPSGWNPRKQGWRSRLPGFLLNFTFAYCFAMTLDRQPVSQLHISAIVLIVVVTTRVLLDWRKKKTGPLGAWLMMLGTVGWVAYRWFWVW